MPRFWLERNKMKSIGKIISAEGEFAVAEIEEKSACTGDCSSCASCKSGKKVNVRVLNKCGAKPGETVYITLPGTKAFTLAAMTYILPLVIFFVASAFLKSEIAQAAVLLLSFAVMAVLANLLAKRKCFMSETERIKNADF